MLSTFKTNRTLFIIALIALVNMLGYGIVIPILYAYSKKFGLSDLQNGFLFAIFSVCSFLSTPVIGRLSDKYGRRPLLIISIFGTVVSFFMQAFAPSAFFLFLARALDGLTAGNIPVAFAVISDSTKIEDRPKAFGLVSGAFSFGFVFGPATAALTVGFGSGVPFIVAGVITAIAALLTFLYLPETNTHMGEVHHRKLFDFPKLWHTLFDPNVGDTFLIALFFYLAFGCAIVFGYQPFTLKILHVNQSVNAILFTMFGIVGLLSQTFLVQRFSKMLGVKRAFSYAIAGVAAIFFIMFFARWFIIFTLVSILLGVANSTVQTLLPTILSQEADAKSQGSIMGLSASYQSIGMMIGPILGGLVATIVLPLPFLVGAVLVLFCYYLSFKVMRKNIAPESAF